MACPVTSGRPLLFAFGASTTCWSVAQRRSGRTSVLTPSPLSMRPALVAGPLILPRFLDPGVPCLALSKPLTLASIPCADPSPRAAWQSFVAGCESFADSWPLTRRPRPFDASWTSTGLVMSLVTARGQKLRSMLTVCWTSIPKLRPGRSCKLGVLRWPNAGAGPRDGSRCQDWVHQLQC